MYVATTMEAYERRDVAERSDISPGVRVRGRGRGRGRGRVRVRVRVGLYQGAAGRSGIAPKRVPAPSDVSGASWPCPPLPVCPTPRPRVDCLVDDEACLMTLTLPAAIK